MLLSSGACLYTEDSVCLFLKKMLPQFTTSQVKNGIDSTDFMIDLSEYVKKKDAISRTELDSLSEVVANKLDATPQHKHHIEDIKQLQSQLDSKYDKTEKYSYNVILNDTEKIPYLEAPKIEIMELVANKDVEGYKFYVDNSNGDLMIVLNDVLIGTYVKSSGNWVLGGVNLREISSGIGSITELNNRVQENSIDIASEAAKITGLMATVTEYMAKTDAVMKNHYDALLALCEKHGMIDSNTSDGDQITPA